MRCLLLILVLLAGCNTIEITSLQKDNLEIKCILEKHFTEEALAIISNIKIYEGLHIYPFVTGVNLWSDIAGLLTFNGFGKKIIASQGSLHKDGLSTIIHEYMHHIDAAGRSGMVDLIDRDKFYEAFKLMERNAELSIIARSLRENSNSWITDIFGIGHLSELIAYTASWVAMDPGRCPIYMHRVFSRVFRISKLEAE